MRFSSTAYSYEVILTAKLEKREGAILSGIWYSVIKEHLFIMKEKKEKFFYRY